MALDFTPFEIGTMGLQDQHYRNRESPPPIPKGPSVDSEARHSSLGIAHDVTILKGGLLAAELNTVNYLTILKGGLLAAELNTANDLTILKCGLLAAE